MENTIRVYQNTVHIKFSKWGDNYSLNVPHYKKWINLISFLKRRGFSVKENQYYKKEYKCLSKYHKIGYKNGVVCLMEISSASIEVQFGNHQNLWHDMPQSMWSDSTDERYTQLSYLENKAVELEVYKTVQYFIKRGHNYLKNDNEYTVEELIIRDNQINSHIHGKNINSLDDIGKSITQDSYDYKYNSNDANKKKILCGDTKYYYDWRTNRLNKGIAYHHINNMWWVLSANNTIRRNIAAFELFDYNSELPKKKRDPRNIIKHLKKAEEEMDYIRCLTIKKTADKLGINLK